MFKNTLIATSIVLMGLSSTLYAKEPKNISIVKQELVKYHDSGEYNKDLAKVAHQAMEYLKTRIESDKKKGKNTKMAIVLDIDETSLSNYNDMLHLSFGGTNQQINDAEGNGTDPAIEPVLALFRYAKANNIAVFFITGRTERYRDKTITNLDNVGYKPYDGINFKPEDYHEKTASIYKIRMRGDIEKQGYDIVLNAGDQVSDLVGGHADKTFKLPNPYYTVP